MQPGCIRKRTVLIRNILEIRHILPGRIRFRVYPMRRNAATAAGIEKKVNAMDGVIWTRVNLKCGALVIGFREARIPADHLVQAVRQLFVQESVPSQGRNACACTMPEEHTGVRPALLRFGAMSLVTGTVFVRETMFGVAVAQTLFSPLGIITVLAAVPLVLRGIRNLRERRFSLESFLGATIVAAVATGEATAALEILWITGGADLLTAWITERSRRAIRDILEVTEKNTYILVDGTEVEVPVSQVQPDDIVAVHTGEKISVDGEITKGEAVVDESPINGRSGAAVRVTGDRIFAGTFVREGVIHIRAEKVGDCTYLARIIRMVEDSLENKAPIEGAAEELARKLIRTGFFVTLGTLLLTGSLWRAFTVMLVMACPCATVLAATTAVSAAMSAAARRHILIKGGRYLEEVGKAGVICFDKTGTLTTNLPEICDIRTMTGVSVDDLVQMTFSAEKHNSHPLAMAIRAEAERRNITAIPHDICEFFPGRGVRSEIRGEEVLVGNAKLMRRFGVNIDPAKSSYEKFYSRGLTTVFIARRRQIRGIIGFANRNRPEVLPTIRFLREKGMEIAMITGDEKYSALGMADQLGIRECYYSVMPEEKAGIVRKIRKKGRKVLMVGDGINDALALADADVGIAMGAGGSEVAVEAADIALVRDELDGIVYVCSLSRETMKIIHQNFRIATGSNIVGVILGAMGWLSPVMAGMIHIIHTVGILANSGRLLFYEAPSLPETPALAVEETCSCAEILHLQTLKRIA